jgi:uncharacterized protein DUF2442
MQIGNWLFPEKNLSGLNHFGRGGIMATLLDVVSVRATQAYLLYLEFENGEKKVFDMTLLMDKKPFVRLKGSPLFLAARVDYGTVCWPGNIDIAPETLYNRSIPL